MSIPKIWPVAWDIIVPSFVAGSPHLSLCVTFPLFQTGTDVPEETQTHQEASCLFLEHEIYSEVNIDRNVGRQAGRGNHFSTKTRWIQHGSK